MLSRTLAIFMVAGGMMCGTTAGAQERTLKIAHGVPADAPIALGHQALADYLLEESDMKAELYAMSLLSLGETSPGVRDGIADMGYVLPQYYPAEYADSNLAGDLSLLSTLGTNPVAPAVVMGAAYMEYNALNCTDCLELVERQNQLPLIGVASADYTLFCRTPIEGVSDLKGKVLRAGGGSWGRWAEHFGATKVSIPFNEAYEALAQGVVDCVMGSIPDSMNFQLQDVAKYVITGVPGGVFPGFTTVNLDTWRGLTVEQRAQLLRGAARASARINVGYQNSALAGAEKLRAEGKSVQPSSSELNSASAEFVRADVAVIAKQFETTYGIKDVANKIAIVTALIEKWKGKIGEIDSTNEDAVSELLWTEIYSKLDPETYGID